MTPEAFVAKWSETTTKERASAQEWFIDLCRLLNEQTPHEADPHGEWYAFEKGVEKTGAGNGWADVWKRHCFGWEYKSKSGGSERKMSAALAQLQQYALALESPPLLIVSDIDTIEIHTAFQNAVQEVHLITLEEILDHNARKILKWAFTEPERLKPKRTRNQITQKAAGQFAQLAFDLRAQGHDPLAVAHFLNKILFCMFAEDAGILRKGLFTEVSEAGVEHLDQFDTVIKRLFQVMERGGPFGVEIIDWFNGGLFDDDTTLPLTLAQIRTIRDMAYMDWSQIEPAIFGTLFERGLDPAKRSQLGAHYTDPESIMRLVNPTIVEPLLAEWQSIKPNIALQMERMEKVKTKQATETRRKAAQELLYSFLEKLRNFRVLDPACGSGNFLYLALHALKNIEHRVNIEAEALGLERQNPQVGPESVLGIEINTYAAELARVTIWIGEIQWMLSHGYAYRTNPILKPLSNIEERDAITEVDGSEASWPPADVIVGNPPFLGDKRMRRELGDDYVEKLRNQFKGKVPGGADLVTYWYEKSRKQIEKGQVKRVGLVATNSIRAGKNREVLKNVAETSILYEAWSDEPWINEGAAVRVSLICFGEKTANYYIRLNGAAAAGINTDLTVKQTYSDNDDTQEHNVGFDITVAKALKENFNRAFIGSQKGGKFDISGSTAREWLIAPNPHGRSNREVIRPWANGMDIARRPRDVWIIDFGCSMSESEAALFEKPFEYVVNDIKPKRLGNREGRSSIKWWRHQRPRPKFRAALSGLNRFIATPRVAKHRIFVWLDASVLPDSRLVAIARDDDVSMGILQSRIHGLWTLSTCSWHGVGNDPTYNAQSVFETFPFPEGLSPNIPPREFSNPRASIIVAAAQELIQLRDNWLNPPEWVGRVPEVVPGYPDRVITKPGHEAELKKRTLTNLYNANPAWLQNAHQILDEAVAASYGWEPDISEEEILTRLLELNLSRTEQN